MFGEPGWETVGKFGEYKIEWRAETWSRKFGEHKNDEMLERKL